MSDGSLSLSTTAGIRLLADRLAPWSWPDRLQALDNLLLDLFDGNIHPTAIEDLMAGRNIHFRPPEDVSLAKIVHKLSGVGRSLLTDALVLMGEPAEPITEAPAAVICLLANRPTVQNATVRWINANGLTAFRTAVNGRPGVNLLMLAAAFGRPADFPDSLVRVTHRLSPWGKGRAA